jgi:RimJ/RimL family protein N-acetyltransferase
MRHDLCLAGSAFRLRPVGNADASLILWLRTKPELNRFLHGTSPSLDDQLTWLDHYYERPGDYYFVVERQETGVPEGVVSIYDIDPQSISGEWGRWILKPGSLAAVESAWLIYRCAFEQLDLRQVYCRTVADNTPVVSFHDSCGIAERRLLPGYFDLNGRLVDAVEHRVERQTWRELGPRLERLAKLTAQRLQGG